MFFFRSFFRRKKDITLEIKRYLSCLSPGKESNPGLYKSAIIAKFSDTTQPMMDCQKEKEKENKQLKELWGHGEL